jgi:hypothetical protein
LRWVAEKEFYGEAADFDVSAADGVKEGGVRRGAESTRDEPRDWGGRDYSWDKRVGGMR